MKLGMISWIKEENFAMVKDKGLEFIELCVNSRAEEFLANVENIKKYSEQYDIPVQSVGRWGIDHISKEGICTDELKRDYEMLDATAALGCSIYVTGCNYVEELSYYENCTLAITYFEKLIAYAQKYNIRIATYNCRWNNFVCDPMAYKVIHGYLKDLYIKYDTSHCIYAGGDYLQEARDWADRFVHVHLKGALVIDGKRFDDPPAGMDMTNRPAFLAILYANGYDGGLSIEPHSANWSGELGDKGLNKTIEYFKSIML